MITIEEKKNRIKYQIKNRFEIWEKAPNTAYKKQELERLSTYAERLDEVVYLTLLGDVRAMIGAGENLKEAKKDARAIELNLTPEDKLYQTVAKYRTIEETNLTPFGDEIVASTMKELGYTTHIPTTEEIKKLEIAKDVALANWYADPENLDLRVNIVTAEKEYQIAMLNAGYNTFNAGLPINLPSVKEQMYNERIVEMQETKTR